MEVDEFLAHFGVKGMRWGVSRNSGNSHAALSKSPTPPAEVKAHNELSDILSKGIKTAKREDHLERIIDKAHLNGYIEGNIKVGSVSASADGKKINYSFKVYRLTQGKSNTSAQDGVKVEYIDKTVDRDPRPGMSLADDNMYHTALVDAFLSHYGVKGQKWGVRRDERPLGDNDRALNISQRAQVKVASSISALAAIGMTTNAAATLFQLQSRWEHLQAVNAVINEAQNNPLIGEAGRAALQKTKSNVIKGIVGSAMATTAISLAIGIVSKRTASAYFAPMHKVYGDVKPKINGDLRKLSKDIKSGKRPRLTVDGYNKEVASIVQKHMTEDKSNMLKPFHELARSQLGLEYNTKPLDIKFEALPNTDLMNKMTVTTPDGLVLVKAIKVVEHAAFTDDSDAGLDFYFDYKFDDEGYISEFSCPTMEVAKDLVDGTFDLDSIAARFDTFDSPKEDGMGDSVAHTDFDQNALAKVDTFLSHFGVKGMKWGVRRPDGADGTVTGGKKGSKDEDEGIDVDSKAMRKMPAGSTVARFDADGEPTILIKKTDGTWKETRISADAERMMKTHQKEGQEMSDREIKEAVGRANLIKQYDQMFNSDGPNKALQDQVDALRLKKELGNLNAEMNPSKIAKVASFAKSAAPAYAAFQKADEFSGGALSGQLKKTLGIPEKARNPKDLLDEQTAIMKSKKAFQDATDALKPPTPEPYDRNKALQKQVDYMKTQKAFRELATQLNSTYKPKHALDTPTPKPSDP